MKKAVCGPWALSAPGFRAMAGGRGCPRQPERQKQAEGKARGKAWSEKAWSAGVWILFCLTAAPWEAPAGSGCRSALLSFPPEREVFRQMKSQKDHYVQFALTPDLISGEPRLQAMALRPFPDGRLTSLVKTSKINVIGGFIVERTKRVVEENRIAWRLDPVRDYDESYVFDVLQSFGHESLHFIDVADSGLRAIAAISGSALGRGSSIGGTRVQNYTSEAEGLLDVLRLSEGMTLKAAAANIPAGGGKAVIFASPESGKPGQLLRSYGEYLSALNQLNGHKAAAGRPFFSTGEDMGLEPADLDVISQTGRGYIMGLVEGGSESPSALTARGVLAGIRAAAQHALNKSDVKDLNVTVQGAGKAGGRLIELLSKAEAKVSVHDVDAEKARCLSQRFGARLIDGREALNGVCDVFAPCAGGGAVNAETVRSFQCKIIAGSANNQLEDPKYGDILKERGILYAPDYVINAGGLISVSRNIAPLTENQTPAEWANEKTLDIYNTLMHIFQIAARQNISPAEAADQLARRRIQEAEEIMRALLAEKKAAGKWQTGVMWPQNQQQRKAPAKPSAPQPVNVEAP